MNITDTFTNIIVPYCDTPTIGRLARVSRIHYLVIEQNPIYRQFAQFYDPSYEFYDICANGHLHIAKWIYCRGIDIYAQNDYALRRACRFGQFEIAQWLLTLGANIHAHGDQVLKNACKGGKLDILKWLHKLGVNINLQGDVAFLSACTYGRLGVAKWIHELGNVEHHMYSCAAQRARMRGHMHMHHWIFVDILGFAKI